MNLVNIIGRLGRDPELKYATSGIAVCAFSLAVDEGNDKPPSWLDIVAFEKQAESASQYLAKGDECAVSGRLKQESWQNEAGEKRSRVVIVASRVDFLRKKGESAGTAAQAKPPATAQAAAPADAYGPVGDAEDPFGDQT